MTSRSKWPRKLIKTVKGSDVGVWEVLYKLAKKLSWSTKHYPNSWSLYSWFESWRVLYRVLCYPSESSGFTFAHPSQLKFNLNLTFNSSVLSALRLTLEGPSGSSPAIRCFGDGLHVGSLDSDTLVAWSKDRGTYFGIGRFWYQWGVVISVVSLRDREVLISLKRWYHHRFTFQYHQALIL